MTTPILSHCHRSLPANRLWQAIACVVAALALAEVHANDVPALAASEHTLYLDTTVNQAATGKLARFVLRGDTLLASEATLLEMGLRLPADTRAQQLIELPSLAGVSVQYDAPLQRVNLQVPVEMLDRPTAHVDLSRNDSPLPDPRQRVAGAVFNYDLYGQHAGDDGSINSYNEMRLFGIGRGIWSNTMSSHFNTGHAKGNGRARNRRLDSHWQRDFPESMLTLTVGDTITGSQDWTRATRIGGIRLSRNFALQPYRTTTPLASFAGEAVLPSTVDLYIDGIRQSSQPLPPGRFQLDSTPTLSGTGVAQMVITDINGQSRTVGFNLYGTPQLLQAGLSDWSLELGSIRRDYGLESFSYGDDPMVSGSLRHGMNNYLTVQTHAEASRGIRQGGAGAVLLLGKRGGVLSGSWAGSRTSAATGQQRGLGYQWNSHRFSASASTTRRSANYRDVAAVQEASTLSRRTEQAFLGFNTPAGQLGMSYVRQEYPGTPRRRYAGVNWSHSLTDNSVLNLGFHRDLGDNDADSAFLYWSVPLNRHTTTATSVRHDRHTNNLSVEANHSPNRAQGELGWRVQASRGTYQRGGARGEINQQGRYGQWSAGLEHVNGADNNPMTYASANGGLAFLGGRLHALPRVDDAFALVTTSGVAGVPVQLENRTIGVTDKHGQLLVPQLSAWQRNQLSINPLDLPADMLVETTRQDAVPETRSGIEVGFGMRRTLSVQFGLRDGNGQWLPAGSRITVAAPDNSTFTSMVGHEGKVYLLDPPAGARLHFGTGNDQCSAALPDTALSEGRLNLPDVICQ